MSHSDITAEIETFTFAFPSEEDAELACHTVEEILAVAEDVLLVDYAASGRLVEINVSFYSDCGEESVFGAEAMLENWASSTGGYGV